MKTITKIYIFAENRSKAVLGSPCLQSIYSKPYGIYAEDMDTLLKEYTC